MDTSLDTEAPVPRKKKTYKKKNDPDRNGSDVRRSSRTRAGRNARDPVSDSEQWNGKQKCIRWNTLEKQLLLRALKEKTAIAQFNYLAIKRHVKTKKKSDVEIYLKNLRKKAMKTKIESMKLKSPIEIWNNLMTHFGDQDREAWKAMSKVMIMASVERTVNSEEIKCDEFKPCRIYRYLSDLFKSKHPTKLTPLESQVILDCFENMLEVLKESEIRDKAAFLRPQYFNLFNKAFTGGTDYSNEDSLSLVYANMASSQRGTKDPGPSRVEPGTEEAVPTTDQATGLSNPGTSRTEAGTSEPGIEPDPATSSTERTSHVGKQDDISQRNKASWRGGKDRSTEVRILNPLGIPVEMLEFKSRDDERYGNKRWTYLSENDSSDSGDSSGDDYDGEDVDRIRKQEKWKSGRPGTTGTGEADAENSAGVGAGELNGIQEMTDLVDADQYAFVTEEDFAKKEEVYLQALKEVHADSDDRLGGDQAIDSDQYVFVSKYDLAIQEENSGKSLDETRREEHSEFVQTIEQQDEILSTANKADGGLEINPTSAELSCAPSDDEQLEEDRNENGSKNVTEGPDIDQIEDIDHIGQSVLMDDLGSDNDSNHSEDDEFDTSLFDGEAHGLNGSGPTEVDGSTNFTPSKLGASPSQRTKRNYLLQPVSIQVKRETVSPLPAGNNQSSEAVDKNRQGELRSNCRENFDILTAVSLVSNKSLVSHPSQEKGDGRVPKHQVESVASSSRRMDDDTILPAGSESPGIEKSKPVQFDHDEENPEIARSFQESPDHSTPNTIHLAKAFSKGMVSNQKSDDQLLTIDVSQLGPDSNIVIPSYLLPGGILTIRSPEVPFMRIQRSDPSPLVQIGTDAADANIALDTGDQAQSDVSPMDLAAEDNVKKDSGPGSDVDSPSEDDMSQTEYVIASDKLSKQSENLCEVHVIANHFVKSQDQGEVPQEISSKMQDVTVKQETSQNQPMISKKSGTYTRLAGAQAEGGSDVEEQSFLDFLSSQKSMFDGRMESTPRSHPLQDKGVENLEEGEPDMHVQAAPNVNIPMNKAWKSNKLLKTSQHASSDILCDMKHKGPSESETKLTVPGKPVNTAADVGQGGTSSDLHSGQKRKRGRPPKPRPPVIEKSTLASKLQEDHTKVSPGAKRKRGRPRKSDTGVPSGVLDIENGEEKDVNLSAVDSDTEREGKRKSGRPQKLPMSDIALNQSTEKDRNYLWGENSDSESKGKIKGVQPHTKALANSSDWQVTQLLVEDDIYTGWREIGSQTETTEKRKRGRSASEMQESTSEEEKSSPSLVMTPYINQTKYAFESESGTNTKEKRKRGRPRKYSLLSSFENLQESPVMPVNREETPMQLETGSRTKNEEKKKRGRPRKDPLSSAGNLPERLVLPVNSETIHKQFETNSDTVNIEKRKRGRPRKDLLSSMKDLQDTPVRPSHTGNEIGQTGLGISLSAKKAETRKGVRLVTIKTEESRESRDDLLGWINASQSTGTEALNEQSDIVISSESEEFSNAGQPSKEFSPYQSNKSNPCLENREKQKLGTNSEAKVLRTDSLSSVFDSSSKAESVDVEKRGSDRLTVLRGSPLNGESKEKSGTCVQDADVSVEVEKRKRGRPRKSPGKNYLVSSPKTVAAPAPVEVKQKCDNVSTAIPSHTLEGAKRVNPIETKGTSSQGSILDQASASLASDVVGGLMMKKVHRPTKEMTSNPSKELSYPLWTQSGKVVCVYNVGDSKTIMGTVQLENPNKASHCRKILPAPPKSGEGNSNPTPFQPPNHQGQIKTTQSHLQEAGEQGTRDHLKRSKPGSTYAGGAKDTTNKAGKKAANISIKSEIVTQESSSCKPEQTDANIGIIKGLEKRKRGRPPKSSNTLLQDKKASYTQLINETLSKGSATDPHHILDIQQSKSAEASGADGDSGQSIPERRGSPQKRSRFESPLKETSQTNALQTTDAGTKNVNQKLSGVRKQVSLDRYLSAQESGASKIQGKATKGILKKRKKQSPLKVNVGKELAKKRQKGFESTRLSEASPVKKRLSPRKKPVTNTFPESHSPFGKPKKRVSFEDAIDLVNTLGERGVVENDLFHTDIVHHTAMKEVMKIVKSVGVKRDIVAEPETSKKSIFFSIKKS